MNRSGFVKLRATARILPIWLLASIVICLTLAASPVILCVPAQASIVDVTGIEVPPANGPSPVDGYDGGDDGGYDDGSSDSGSNTTSTPQPQPQPTQPTVDPAVQKQELFEQEKKALLDEFTIPASLQDFTSYNAPLEADPVQVDEDTVMGAGSIPTGLGQPGGLSPEEWKEAGECQKQLDELYTEWPLSADEITYQEQLEVQRNNLWMKAVSTPGLTAEERERLRLNFHVMGQRAGGPPPPVVTSDAIKKWKKPSVPPLKNPTSSTPVPDSVNPLTAMILKESLINRPTAGVEYIGQEVADDIMEDSPFGDMLGLAKIAVAYKTGGQASARAATADFLVGLLRYPQASFAVDGGRVYANVTFQALNRFMTDASKATGTDFDKEEFWSELKDESSTGMKGLMEWIGDGAE